MIISIPSTFVVLLRLYRWTQVQWELVRTFCQEQCRKAKEFWANYIFLKREFQEEELLKRQDLQRQKTEHRKEELDKKLDSKAKMAQEEYAGKLERLKISQEIKKLRLKIQLEKLQNIIKKIQNGIQSSDRTEENIGREKSDIRQVARNICTIVFSLVIVVLFFILPSWNTGITGWIEKVAKLSGELKGGSESFSGQNAIVYYFFFFVAIVAITVSAIYLIASIILKKHRMEDGKTDWKAYMTPCAIFLVFGVLLFVLTNDSSTFDTFKSNWYAVLVGICSILGILITVKVVRIMLDLCSQHNFLLKKIFVFLGLSVDEEGRKQQFFLWANKEKRQRIVDGVKVAIIVLFGGGIFLFLPFLGQIISVFDGWLKKVETLVHSLGGKELEGQGALLYYLLFFIVVVVSILTAIYFIYCFVSKKQKTQNENGFQFIDYVTPAAIFLVFAAMLFVMTEGIFDFSNIESTWKAEVVVILFILVAFMAFEIVRIILEQLATHHSLLKKLIRLVFVVILNFLVGLVLEVFTSINIKSLFSSILAILLPDDNDSLKKCINYILEKMFLKEVNNIDKEEKSSLSGKFSRKRVWRRHK